MRPRGRGARGGADPEDGTGPVGRARVRVRARRPRLPAAIAADTPAAEYARSVAPAAGTAVQLWHRVRFQAHQLIIGLGLLGGALLVVQLGGLVLAFALVLFVIPGTVTPGGEDPLWANARITIAYVVVGLAAIAAWARRRLRGWTWLQARRPPTAREQQAVLRAPLRIMAVSGVLWAGGTAVLFATNLHYDAEWAVRITITGVMVGMGTSAVSYLIAERLLRPMAARALEARPPDRSIMLGTARRQMLGWLLGTGTALVAVIAVGVKTLAGSGNVSADRLAVAMIALGGLGFVIGLLVEVIVSRAVADPVGSLRVGFERLARGELDARIVVYDGTELGLLQDGFNRMAAGLQERARLRDLFGRHVGEDVARAAVDGEIRLGGETRDVCALFVDIVGSTALAAGRRPQEIVALLNRFFAIVVQEVGEHRGWVNKFQGDAALVVFGAPVDQPDAPDRALRSARALADRLAAEVPELRAGIGVSGGLAVAGNIGSEERFEYTVTGDPINEAARLTEVAKECPGLVAASGRLVARASAEERARWRLLREVTVRGRDAPTAVMVPSAAADEPAGTAP